MTETLDPSCASLGLRVLNVFRGTSGGGGNPLGVVTNGAACPGEERRRALAARLGYSETIFIDDAERGVVDIHTPSVRLPFAGHPLVGAAWLLGPGVSVLRPPAGEVAVRREGEVIWVRGRAEWAPGRRTEQYGSVAEVDALPAPPPGEGWLYAWAWQDEKAGVVRARGFPRRGDSVVEDEATGASALVLTDELGRPLDIRQGVASRILTRPHADGTIELGGTVAPAGPAPAV
ncbi:phenazine biosynthesis protein PhzC/PhzF [Streptomyces cinnamoneus]|uniref:Phenazine biosynthesis protein PhzC/PhzF n=1 Tax=Streptomyces cinnamoneus TaxID=53446 RepID=A0A2G1X9P2_STRCJ|nr:PhzF family phenazine biosynthesis protein [Streptomyces cinnamoneus]PHQ47889.1 phenazine biosynthesis protein PhzC/PhzF [Streptomyces cinnamoneus]PPT15514.1 PhzF family phenazine biosynthesis protein [Streptomyces cinnamoneus]